jgi:hypothetical protein
MDAQVRAFSHDRHITAALNLVCPILLVYPAS